MKNLERDLIGPGRPSVCLALPLPIRLPGHQPFSSFFFTTPDTLVPWPWSPFAFPCTLGVSGILIYILPRFILPRTWYMHYY